MKKHVNYQQGVLTIDLDPIVDASGTNVSEVIEAFTSQSDDILSASIGSIENLETVNRDEHSTLWVVYGIEERLIVKKLRGVNCAYTLAD